MTKNTSKDMDDHRYALEAVTFQNEMIAHSERSSNFRERRKLISMST